MCVILISPLSQNEKKNEFQMEAVQVSGGFSSNSDGEKLETPKQTDTFADGKWSFYDYIGNLFAGLIFGEW